MSGLYDLPKIDPMRMGHFKGGKVRQGTLILLDMTPSETLMGHKQKKGEILTVCVSAIYGKYLSFLLVEDFSEESKVGAKPLYERSELSRARRGREDFCGAKRTRDRFRSRHRKIKEHKGVGRVVIRIF
jgi:hypothetical protein